MLKSRKKMLLSSIAMLLVALVALGSATFAWYMTNDTVTASTTTFSASTAEGLVIRHHNGETWTNSITDLLQKKEDSTATPATKGLTPASMTYANTLSTTRGGSATAAKFDESAMKSGTLEYKEVTNGNFFLVDEFYVASSNSSDKTASFTIKDGSTKAGTYLNLAVYVNDTLTKVLTTDPNFDATEGLGALENGSTNNTVVVGSNFIDSKIVKFTSSVSVGNITATPKGGDNTGCHIQLVAFADGFNEKCTSKTASIEPLSCTYEFSTVTGG